MDPKTMLQLAQDKTESGRSRLATAISQFFADEELTEPQQRLAGEILLNLIQQAEVDLRQALSERLSVQENVPPDLIVFLANDEISVAQPVLLHSPILKDIDLIYVIAAKGQDHWKVIAQRETLSPIVAEKLIDTEDPGTVLNLIDNQRVKLQRGAVKKLVRAAMRSEELQAPLLRRPEVDADTATDLYMVVSNALRKEIIDRFKTPPQVVEQAMDRLVRELSMEAHGTREITPDMTALARRFGVRSEITPDLMIKTLRRGQVSFFIALFAEKTGFSSQNVTVLIQKDEGKAFVVACRSIGMMKSEFASIFLLSRGIRSGDKIVDQRELAMALKYYDTLKDFDVNSIMKVWARDPSLI